MGGRGVRVGIIDSGVNIAHPHIVGVAGGVTIGETIDERTYTDIIGHGTAVTAAIQEKAPEAEYFAVRVFCSSLRTRVEYLVRAIEWCIDQDLHVINLSLGTTNATHARLFEPVIARAVARGVVLVSARENDGCPTLPGILPGVIAVGLDWDCPRESYRYTQGRCTQGESGVEFFASGYPRDLPGVPRKRNLYGISFAVANLTGFVVRACETLPARSPKAVQEALIAAAP
jgi:Subtilase family